MLCSTDSSTLNTRQLPPRNSENRQGRNILTAVECRRATAGLLLLGSYDRSVPRSCEWQTRQSGRLSIWQCTTTVSLFAATVPIEKSADLEMDGREDFQNLLCLWAAALKQIRLRKGWRSRRILRMWVLPTSRKRRQRLPQKPHTPSESPRYFAAVG